MIPFSVKQEVLKDCPILFWQTLEVTFFYIMHVYFGQHTVSSQEKGNLLLKWLDLTQSKQTLYGGSRMLIILLWSRLIFSGTDMSHYQEKSYVTKTLQMPYYIDLWSIWRPNVYLKCIYLFDLDEIPNMTTIEE